MRPYENDAKGVPRRGVVALERLQHAEHARVLEVAVRRERVVRQGHAARERAHERERGDGDGAAVRGRRVGDVAFDGVL